MIFLMSMSHFTVNMLIFPGTAVTSPAAVVGVVWGEIFWPTMAVRDTTTWWPRCLQISLSCHVLDLTKLYNHRAKLYFSYIWSSKTCLDFYFPFTGEMWRQSYSGGNIWQSWQEDCHQQARKILQTARSYQELFNDSRTHYSQWLLTTVPSLF